MRYIELMESESTGLSVNDLNLPDNFWTIPSEINGEKFFYLRDKGLTSLYGCPDETNYSLIVRSNKLTSLEGAPKKIMGDFDCYGNKQLVSLAGSPKYIDNAFNCANTNIKSLSGGPDYVGGSYICRNNSSLNSLEGAPKKIMSYFCCNGNRSLRSLVGGPTYVEGGVDCSKTKITTLVGSPEYVGGDFECCDNKLLVSFEGGPRKIMGSFTSDGNTKLTSLKDIHKHLPEIHGKLIFWDCPIESHILGVFFIKGFMGIAGASVGDFPSAAAIVNKHIKNGRAGLLPCQAELIEAGLDDYAQI